MCFNDHHTTQKNSIVSLVFSTVFLTIHLNHLERIFEKLDTNDNANNINDKKLPYHNNYDCRKNCAYDKAKDLEGLLTRSIKPQCSIQSGPDVKIIDSYDEGAGDSHHEKYATAIYLLEIYIIIVIVKFMN